MMETTDIACIKEYVAHQLSGLFRITNEELVVLGFAIETAFSRTIRCLKSHSACKNRQGINLLNGDEYAVFLYFLSNTIYRIQGQCFIGGVYEELAEKIYLLNKNLSSMDLYYQVEMPNYFRFGHTIGIVIGRGCKIGDYFYCLQNCTIGDNGGKGCMPVLGCNVYMFTGSAIFGDSVIGNNVIISAGTYIKDAVIPDCSIVYGNGPDLVIKPSDDKIKNIKATIFE